MITLHYIEQTWQDIQLLSTILFIPGNLEAQREYPATI